MADYNIKIKIKNYKNKTFTISLTNYSEKKKIRRKKKGGGDKNYFLKILKRKPTTLQNHNYFVELKKAAGPVL